MSCDIEQYVEEVRALTDDARVLKALAHILHVSNKLDTITSDVKRSISEGDGGKRFDKEAFYEAYNKFIKGRKFDD